jgi:hypothetical protein
MNDMSSQLRVHETHGPPSGGATPLKGQRSEKHVQNDRVDSPPARSVGTLVNLLDIAHQQADAAQSSDRQELIAILDRADTPRPSDGARAIELAKALNIDTAALRELAALAAAQQANHRESAEQLRAAQKAHEELTEQIAHRSRELDAMATINADARKAEPALLAAVVATYREQ